VKTLVFIPARGGSKSIPMKNLALFDGKPLIKHAIKMGVYALGGDFVHPVISTDSPSIKAYAELCAETITHNRPEGLSGDDSNVFDAFKHFWMSERDNHDLWDVCVFLQPTYPLVERWHIDACLQALKLDQGGASAQTIIPVPHDFHEYNQRETAGGNFITFVDRDIRADCYNKQRKPTRYAFGGVLVFSISEALEQETLFPSPSIGIHIPPLPIHDIDSAADLALANLLRKEGVI